MILIWKGLTYNSMTINNLIEVSFSALSGFCGKICTYVLLGVYPFEVNDDLCNTR